VNARRLTLARLLLGGMSLLAVGPGLLAQTADVETEPIRCWWRTSVPAVRVGEPFSIVLTCAVVETEGVTVVPNETELAPNAMQLPPFDLLGGSHGEDLRTSDRRFFQYEYRVRLVSDEFFGKDLRLPEMKITYKVRTRLDREALEGRDQSYILPEASVRVLSQVPADAADIRDAYSETFGDIDRLLARANLLRVTGLVLMAFGALAAAVALVRLAAGSRARLAAPRALVSDAAVLRQVGRELSTLEQAQQAGDWTPALTSRLLTIVRILCGYALELPPSAVSTTTAAAPGPRPDAGVGAPAAVADRETAAEGQLAVRSRGLRGGSILVPAWVTPSVMARERARTGRARPGGRSATLDELQRLLTILTAMQYGRHKGADEEVIRETLDSAARVLRRLKIENSWAGKKLRAARVTRAGLEHRLWSH
jgi:hypothetical protein